MSYKIEVLLVALASLSSDSRVRRSDKPATPMIPHSETKLVRLVMVFPHRDKRINVTQLDGCWTVSHLPRLEE